MNNMKIEHEHLLKDAPSILSPHTLTHYERFFDSCFAWTRFDNMHGT